MTSANILQTIPTYVSAVAAIGAVVVAWRGLQTWRRQLQGTAEYDLARRVLRAVLEVRNQIAAVRSPIILPGEVDQARREQDATKGIDSTRDNEQQLAYSRRWSELVKARSQLTNKCTGELWHAVNRHMREITNQNPPRETDEQWQKRQDVLYDDGSEDNEFTKRVVAVVTDFEELLRPHIGARHSVKRRP